MNRCYSVGMVRSPSPTGLNLQERQRHLFSGSRLRAAEYGRSGGQIWSFGRYRHLEVPSGRVHTFAQSDLIYMRLRTKVERKCTFAGHDACGYLDRRRFTYFPWGSGQLDAALVHDSHETPYESVILDVLYGVWLTNVDPGRVNLVNKVRT